MKIACPKCGFEEEESARECSRCGIVFGKYMEDSHVGRTSVRPVGLKPDPHNDDDEISDGRLGPNELRILAIGLVLAIIAYAIPLTRFILHAMVTLFHEFGHAVVGWLLGYPSIPSFDFVYGGGITPHGPFQLAIALVIAGGFGYLMYLFRQNTRTVILIGAVFLVWLFFVTSEWRRLIVVAAAGHLGEVTVGGILFYQALAGIGWKIPEIERPLGAFVAFFVQINMIFFCWGLIHDPDVLAVYREGKGGMLMHDIDSISADLTIHTAWHPSIPTLARLLLFVSFVPMIIAVVWFLNRGRVHRVLQQLRTVSI